MSHPPAPPDKSLQRSAIPGWPALQVYRELESSPQGLSREEAAERLRRHGPNAVREVQGASLVAEFVGNFTHPMALLLWAGGAIAFLTQTPQLGVAIWLVTLINGAFGFWQEVKAEKAIEALRELIPTYARVLREGSEARVLAAELVLGDVVLLSEGDRISADARLVEATDLRVDQSTMTGESRPVFKTEQPVVEGPHAFSENPDLVFAGTSVIAGHGRAVVFATGMASEFGQIAHLTQCLGEPPNPLQKEMHRVTETITRVSFTVAFVFFWLAHALLGATWPASFMIALGLLIAFVPEGLLPTLSLALAIGVQRMARRHALIKRLSSVETLGRTTVICTDKTGTLTENQMTVSALWLMDGALSVTGNGYAPQGAIARDGGPVVLEREPALGELLRAAVGCNDARLLPPHTELPCWSALGDPTEAALLTLAMKAGLNPAKERRRSPRVHEVAFNSYRRRMSTVHRHAGGLVVYVKGAVDEVLDRCVAVRLGHEERPLSSLDRERVSQALDGYARDGLRVLAFAYRPLSEDAGPDFEGIESQLTFLGLVAMCDPPRADVKEAIVRCHRAGIRIVMLTGDYSVTAAGIARGLGITGDDPRRVSGRELDALGDPELKRVLEAEVVFSRITPEQKLRVVRVLQEAGHVVAVTGDGVNDAPALRQADIGVAMGLSGTDVAKEAADMILTDDHFASIVNAVEEGRAVFDNIRKFIRYVFGSNMAEGVPFLVTLVSRGAIPLPITVMQTLAVDLGTDMVPAIGLGAEPPEADVMERPPRALSERLLDWDVVMLGWLWYGLIDSLAAMSSYFFVALEHGWPAVPLAAAGTAVYRQATTMTLAGIAGSQLGAAIACRSEHRSAFREGLFSNRILSLGLAIEVILLLALMHVPMLRESFGTSPLTLREWGFALCWAPVLVLADEARKAWRRRKSASASARSAGR